MQLAEQFWPGPLTLVLEKQPVVQDIVTAGLPTVMIRVPGASRRSGSTAGGQVVRLPLRAANPFGRISPTTAEHVREQLGDKVDLILDGGLCRVGVESTVLSLVETTPVLLRHGGVPVEELEAVIGPIAIATSSDDDAPQQGPGMLTQHYARARWRSSLTGAKSSADRMLAS
ncbi:MAG: L-threonylcarbamoyladenylate synthase [Planctomycetaceae bacterium]